MIKICRVCLNANSKTHSLNNSPLKTIYEKLTNNKLQTEDERPETACFICFWKLAQCCKFRHKLHKSTEILLELQKHGIEIGPETISILNRGIQHDYQMTDIDNFTYGGQTQKFPVKKEILEEEVLNSTKNAGLTGVNVRLCLVCLSLSSKTYCELGPLQDIYEKLTDTKLKITNEFLGVCYMCCARVRRCKELVSKALKSETIIAELTNHGIKLTQETVIILNKKIKNNLGTSQVETTSFPSYAKTNRCIKAEINEDRNDKKPIIKQETDQTFEPDKDCTDQNVEDPNQSNKEQNCQQVSLVGDSEDISQVCGEADQYCYETSESEGTDLNSDDSHQDSEETSDLDDDEDLEHSETNQISGKSNQLDDNENLEQGSKEHDDQNLEQGNKEQSDNENLEQDENSVRENKLTEICNICGIKFDTIYKRKKHMLLHDPSKKFPCPTCTYRYANKIDLQKHMLVHNCKYVCKLCGRKFINYATLRKHTHIHKNVYNCDICIETFARGNELTNHNILHHPEIIYNCKFCDESFRNIVRFNKHVFLKHANVFPYYTCDYCRKRYASKNDIRTHISKVHLKLYKYKCEQCAQKFVSSESHKIHVSLCDKKKFDNKCAICDKNYMHKFSLITHMETHKTERPFKCQICAKSFKTDHALETHAKRHDKQKLSCDFCEKKYTNQSRYRTHVLGHVNGVERPYKCTYCFKSFITQHYLTNHEKRLHSDATRYVKKLHTCNICNKQVVELSRHMKCHDEQKYSCEICHMKFRYQCNLNAHVETHNATRYRAFMCDECGKDFVRKSHLRIHINAQHRTRVKSFPCDICDKLFYTNREVTSHLGLVHCANKFHCDKCDKIFQTARSLESHRRIKHSHKNPICDLCNTMHRNKAELLKHLKSHTTGMKHYRCNTCKESFLNVRSLYLHSRTHRSEVHENTCKFCQKSFTTSLTLTRHYVGQHDGYRNFGCNICEEPFISLQALSWHLEKVHKIAFGFDCYFCSNVYTRASSLSKHVYKVHQDEKPTLIWAKKSKKAV